MDLLRAVMVGAPGTPYHDGLFFFDVFFPPTYPDTSPVYAGPFSITYPVLLKYLSVNCKSLPCSVRAVGILSFWWSSIESKLIQNWGGLPCPPKHLLWWWP